MSEWLVETLRKHPEVTFFLILGMGYVLGKLKIGSFTLGAVTGTLLAGVLIGQLGLKVADEVKQCFFLLFLFSIGFRTGPQFFRGLRGGGLQQAGLAALVATCGLIVGYLVSLSFGYDAGTAGGLLAGALTESATIGTAGDAISRLPLDAAQKEALANNIPVAFAVTYLIGVIGAAWFLAQVAPKLLRVDLAEECRKLEEQMRGGPGAGLSARREFEARSYTILDGSLLAGSTVGRLEKSAAPDRIVIERLRHGGEVVECSLSSTLSVGDVITVAGRRAVLAEKLNPSAHGVKEVDDRELLDIPVEAVEVVVTNRSLDQRTLGELASDPDFRGIFLRSLSRGGQPVVAFPATKVNLGDILTIVGSHRLVAEAVKRVGFADRVSDVTDMALVAFGIVFGAFVGIPALVVAGVEIGLTLSVGVLFGGLVCGWLRPLYPRVLGRIPAATLWVFESIGLTGFVAVVGLNAGPNFVKGLQASGVSLIAAGVLTIILPLLIGVFAGQWIFKMHPGVMLGVIAGSCTATPALAAVQEAAKSSVPTLGYGIAYAVGNVLLALWGTVIVALIS